MGDVKRCGVAGCHNVGHVQMARWAPGHDRGAPVFLGSFIEASDRTSGHVARPSRLMIMGGAAAIGRSTGRSDIVTNTLQEYDRQPYHLGMPEHVATEPKGDAIPT